MVPALTTLLFFHLQFSLALSLQISSVFPRFVELVSSSVFSHGAYVDQKVHQTPRSVLNHEQWHQRHVAASMNASSVARMAPSSPTGFWGPKSLGPSLSSASASVNSSGAVSLVSALSTPSASAGSSRNVSLTRPLPSASAAAFEATGLASLLGHTEGFETDELADWDDRTESACSAALVALRGVATNPSGLAACYNIRSLDTSTGVFDVDLRLYRISAPRTGWIKLDSSSMGVGLSYVNAVVSAAQAKKTKREDRTLPWFPAQRDEAADIYIRLSRGISPRKVESMTFVGTVDNVSLAELENMTTALSLLTPAITLSGSEQDGTLINTRLSTQDASFVNGVFATASAGDLGATDVGDFVLPGTKLVGFPVGLIISSIWCVLYVMTIGYGGISRYHARESYRRRIKKRFSGDAVTKRTMRWA